MRRPGPRAVGDSKHGRACIRDGAVCRAPGCKPPKALGGCLEAAVDAGKQEAVCLTCEDDLFLADGKCRGKLTCHGSRYRETGERCNCNTRERLAGEPKQDCHRCYHTKKPAQGAVLFKGLHRRCYGCRNAKFAHGARCVGVAECPKANTRHYTDSPYKNLCAAPFTCAAKEHVGGDFPGRDCQCGRKCEACDWQAGWAAPVCRACKPKYFLLAGAFNPLDTQLPQFLWPELGAFPASNDCLSAKQCVKEGGTPDTDTGACSRT